MLTIFFFEESKVSTAGLASAIHRRRRRHCWSASTTFFCHLKTWICVPFCNLFFFSPHSPSPISASGRHTTHNLCSHASQPSQLDRSLFSQLRTLKLLCPHLPPTTPSLLFSAIVLFASAVTLACRLALPHFASLLSSHLTLANLGFSAFTARRLSTFSSAPPPTGRCWYLFILFAFLSLCSARVLFSVLCLCLSLCPLIVICLPPHHQLVTHRSQASHISFHA